MGLLAACVFPQQDGRYSVAELRMLAAALGFPSDSLQSSVPSGSLDTEGISSKDLHRLMELGTFTSALHLSNNMKSGLYNIKVLSKCLDLLEQNILGFAAIRDVKVAFCAHEHLDQRGLRAEPGTLLKVIRMCGFAISPEKLSRHLKQNKQTYVERGRIQLYELLDLLPLCEPRELFLMKEERVGSTDKTNGGIYQLDNMRSLLVTTDEKLARHLDRRFQLNDSWRNPQQTTGSASHLAPQKYQQTPNLNGPSLRPPPCKPEKASVTSSEESWTLVTPVPHIRCHCYTPKPVDPILSERDLQATQNDMCALLRQMETLGERFQRLKNWKLDHYAPGYRELAAARQKPAMSETPRPVTRPHHKPDVFERLSAPRTRMPSPFHALVCDARKLGITTRTRREKPGHSQLSCQKKPHGPQELQGRSTRHPYSSTEC